MIRADVCGVWGHEYRRCLGRMNTGAGHSPIPQMWRRGAWLHPHSASLALIRNILGQNFSLDVVYVSQSASEMLCVSWGIEWCWRSPRPFKQGKGNSFADSGGLKLEAGRAGPAPETERSVIWITRMPALLRPVIIWITQQQWTAQNSWKLPSLKNLLLPLDLDWCLLKYESVLVVEVSQYYPSICFQFWCRPDKTPERLWWPPIKFSSIYQPLLTGLLSRLNNGPDLF